MKQLVRFPTREDRILDLVLTNLPQTYDKNGVEIMNDTRISRKLELGRYLNSINWSLVNSLENCEDKLELMTNLIINGLNHIMPIERVKVHVNGCPWITPNFKELTRHRQNAFISGNTVRFPSFEI